jgi:hypothetical protein
VYTFEAFYWFVCLCYILVFKAQVSTVYEYLEKRFENKTRLLCSFLYILRENITLPLFIYSPALALSTGILHFLIINVSTYLFFSYRCKSFRNCFRDKFHLCLLHCHRWFENRRLDRRFPIRHNHGVYCYCHWDRCKIIWRLLNCVEHSTCRRKT